MASFMRRNRNLVSRLQRTIQMGLTKSKLARSVGGNALAKYRSVVDVPDSISLIHAGWNRAQAGTENKPTDTANPSESSKTNTERYMKTTLPGGKKKVSRDEFAEVLSQISDNINQIANLLMQDLNMMYSRHVFPFQMRLAVLEDLLVEKGFATKEQITELAKEYFEKLEKQAKEIQEPSDSQDSPDNPKSDSE